MTLHNTFLSQSPPSRYIQNILINGAELSEHSLANASNDFFVNLKCGTPNDKPCNYIKNGISNSFFLEPTDNKEVISVFSSINSSCCDADGMQIRPIKHILDLIAPCLVHI